MQGTKRHLHVFLCHASVDKPKVRELYRYLRKRGIRPWLDEVDLVAGQDWQVEIPKALSTSDAIIICLTRNSVDKEGYVQREIKFALDKTLEMPEGRIYLIPVRFEECEVPYSLGRYHWVDLFEPSGFPRLMKSLRARAAQLERASVVVPKLDEARPDLSTRPNPEPPETTSRANEDKNVVLPDIAQPVARSKVQELIPKSLRIITKLKAPKKIIQEIISALISQTETKQKSTGIQSLSKRDKQLFGALLVLAIIVYSALIVSPLLKSRTTQTPEPTRTLTMSAVRIFTSAAQTAYAQLPPTARAITTTQIAAPPLTPTTTVVTATPLCDQAEFVKDVTIPDGTRFSPSQSFTKTWRLKNVGTCTWTTTYKLFFRAGDSMSGPAAQVLNTHVSPGQTIDISVDLRAPTLPGVYRGDWSLVNSSGNSISFGPDRSSIFFVEIAVASLPTSTP